MKLNSIGLLFLFITAFVSCTSKSDQIATTLQQIEQCIEAHPDSALQMLNGISNPNELKEKERADYLLLLTQARDKNIMDISADSSITFAIDYYKKSGDKRKYGIAMYYYGRVLQKSKEGAKAMKVFLEARQILEEIDEYKMLGLLCGNISVLNREQSLYEEAICYCHEAIDYYYQAKDTLGVAYAYQTMGSSFFLKQEMDSVYQCATKSLELLGNNPIRLQIVALKMLGMMYSFEKQYSEAEKIFLKIIDLEPDEKRILFHYMSLGRLYQLMGKKEDAEKYLKLCLESHSLFTRSNAYINLAKLAKSNHDYKQALILKEKADSLLSVAESEDKREDLIQLQIKYQDERREKEKLQIELKNRTNQFVLIVALIMLLGVAYYFYKRYWHTKVQMERIQKTLEKNNRQIESYLIEIENYKKQKNKNDSDTDSKISRLSHQIDELIQENAELRSKADVCELIRILKNRGVVAEKLTQKEWDKIFKLVNCLYFDILIRFKLDYKRLTKRDFEMIAFLLLGFTPKELMFIFDAKDTHTIFTAKSRLKKRLKLKKDDSLDDFLRNKSENDKDEG